MNPIEAGMREHQEYEDRALGLVCLLAIVAALAGIVATVLS